MNLNFFITVIFYTVALLIIHLKLKERENPSNFSNILERYENSDSENLPYEETDTVIPLEDVNTVDNQTNQALLKYLKLEKEESDNKSHNTRLENNDLDKYFSSKSEKYNFKEVPTNLEKLENFSGLNNGDDEDATYSSQISAFEDFENNYATI